MQSTDLSESFPVSVSGGADAPENEVRSQLGQNIEIMVLSSQAAVVPAVQSTNRFFPNLIIAALAFILLLGIVLVVALLRAWLG